jgi:hypothetical protein
LSWHEPANAGHWRLTGGPWSNDDEREMRKENDVHSEGYCTALPRSGSFGETRRAKDRILCPYVSRCRQKKISTFQRSSLSQSFDTTCGSQSPPASCPSFIHPSVHPSRATHTQPPADTSSCARAGGARESERERRTTSTRTVVPSSWPLTTTTTTTTHLCGRCSNTSRSR